MFQMVECVRIGVRAPKIVFLTSKTNSVRVSQQCSRMMNCKHCSIRTSYKCNKTLQKHYGCDTNSNDEKIWKVVITKLRIIAKVTKRQLLIWPHTAHSNSCIKNVCPTFYFTFNRSIWQWDLLLSHFLNQ